MWAKGQFCTEAAAELLIGHRLWLYRDDFREIAVEFGWEPFSGQVMAAVEGNAQELGEERVTTKVMDLVIQKWIETGDFHEGRYGFRA